jgi:hypothetical protein
MTFEEEYEDVLQNIEFGIQKAWQRFPEMSDHDVMRALEALIDLYVGEKIGRGPKKLVTTDAERDIFYRMHAMCEWRMGRQPLSDDATKNPSLEPDKHKSIDEILACLKRILKSVGRWNKVGGRRGYLEFASQYVR